MTDVLSMKYSVSVSIVSATYSMNTLRVNGRGDGEGNISPPTRTPARMKQLANAPRPNFPGMIVVGWKGI
jgi:hypothetical protein